MDEEYGTMDLRECPSCAALRASVASLEERNARMEKVAEAAQILHDQCCVISATGRVLNFGPMLEPSEGAVIGVRRALLALAALGEG